MNRTKRKLLGRTGKQTCPVCAIVAILVEHHIEGRQGLNPHHASKVCYICDNCHRRVHRGLIEIFGWQMTTAGLELNWVDVTPEHTGSCVLK